MPRVSWYVGKSNFMCFGYRGIYFSVFTYILGRLKRCKWRTWSVQWPVVLLSMEKYLKFVEGNNSHHWASEPLTQCFDWIHLCNFVFLSLLISQKFCWYWCTYYLRDTFKEVLLPKHISISSAVLPNNVQENDHCHSTPARSLRCVWFTKDGSDCIALLKADYSISCLSPANGVYRKLVAACAIYPFLSFLYCFLFLFTSTVSLVSMMKFVLVLEFSLKTIKRNIGSGR